MTTGHDLTVTPTEDGGSTTVTAQCGCGHWTLVTPNQALVTALHRLHIGEATSGTDTPD